MTFEFLPCRAAISVALPTDATDAPTGVHLASVDGIGWVPVDDPAAAAAIDAELRTIGHDEWTRPYAFPASLSERIPVTHAPGHVSHPYAWNGDRVMAVNVASLPEIWVSPDAGESWHLVDQEQSVFDGAYPGTLTIDVVFFDGRYVVVGIADWDPTVWLGTWPEP